MGSVGCKLTAAVRGLLDGGAHETRSSLAEAVCGHFGFLDARSRAQTAGCVKALRELERAGHFVLPTALKRGPAGVKSARRLGEPVEVARDMPDQAGDVRGLALVKVVNLDQMRLWNELMLCEHPQGAGDSGSQPVPANLRALSWRGPRLIAAVKPTDPQELLRTVELSLAGIPLSAMPSYWRDYSANTDAAWRAARPVAALLAKYPASDDALARIAASAGQPVSALRFLPLRARHAEWVTLIAAPDSRVVGHLPLDGFV